MGKDYLSVLEKWEEDRDYWYMNFYQDCKQPLIEGDNIVMFDDWIKQLKERFGEDSKKWKFKCLACGHVQSMQDFIDHGFEKDKHLVNYNCIGRFVKGIGCDWTLGGLFPIHKLTVVKDLTAFPVFETAE